MNDHAAPRRHPAGVQTLTYQRKKTCRTVGQLIAALEAMPKSARVEMDFGEPVVVSLTTDDDTGKAVVLLEDA